MSSRRSASESKIFQPSTFASRREDAEAFRAANPPRRRLVSMGTEDIMLAPFGSKGQNRIARRECLMDLDDHQRIYYREAGAPLLELESNIVDSRCDEVHKLEPVARRTPIVSRVFFPSTPDTVTPVE